MPKKAISATIDIALDAWLEKQLKESKLYRNKSHIIEIALEEFKKKR
ncbi:MAG TPA: hypothetical protein VJH97_01095 [Candidatus Nanoarchaeia archaeon]|nr:hypothetical protein [Candidatus Nanoarchaeia archaeon]